MGGELGLNRVLNKVYTGMVDKKMDTNIQFLGAGDISPIMEDHMAKGMENSMEPFRSLGWLGHYPAATFKSALCRSYLLWGLGR